MILQAIPNLISPLIPLFILRLLAGKRLVYTADYLGEKVVAKIFFEPNYKRRWKRELQGVMTIAKSDVNTPDVIASFHEEGQGFACVLFEYIDMAETLGERCKQAADDKEKIEIFKQALITVAQLHDAGVYQKDIHLDNFLQF